MKQTRNQHNVSRRATGKAACVLAGLAAMLLNTATVNAEKSADSTAPRQVENAALAFLKRQIVAGSGSTFDVAELDTRLRLAACDQELEAAWAPGSRKIGAVSVTVRCPSATGWSVIVPGSIHLQEKVVVALRPLLAGSTIAETDIQLLSRDVTNNANQYMTHAADVVGKRLNRPYNRGEVINPNSLATPLLVRRGMQVILRARAGELEVEASGKALGDGTVGQRVRVQNVKSLRIVEGQVLADGSVQISM